MRFLCKKCGAQSPGDLSGIEVRDGALVFVCTSCGTNATLVAAKPGAGADPAPAAAAPLEKGIVEPDEDELVDLGEATLSRMLGRKVRIVADPEASADTEVAEATVEAPAAAVAVAVGSPEPVAAGEEPPTAVQEAVSVREPDVAFAALEPSPSRKRLAGLVAAGLVLAAVVGFALLEARQPSSKDAGLVAAATPGSGVATATDTTGAEAPALDRVEPSPAPSSPAGALPDGPRNQVVPPGGDEKGAIAVKELAPAKLAPAPATPAAATAAEAPLAEVLDAAFWRIRPGVRMCATQEQRRDPDAVLGEEAVSVAFGPSGEVTGVAFERKELEGTPLGACLATEMRKVRLDPGPGRATTVRRVLALSRSSSS